MATITRSDLENEAAPIVPPGLVMAGVILFWGMGPPVSKLITAPAMIAALYRFWLSVPLLLGLSVLLGCPPRWSVLKRTALAGAAFGINMVFVFLALSSAAVAVLSVITTLQPGFILLVAGPILGERPGRWHVTWTVVAIAGTAVVVLGAGAQVHTSAIGVVYAVAAMVAFTLYFLLTKRARSGPSADQIHPIEWMTGISLFAALAVTPLALATSSAADYRAVDGYDWLWLAVVVFITGTAGHVMMAWTHRYIDASRSSLYLLAMNIVAIGAAWPIHHEPLSWTQALGGVIVFGAVAAVISRPVQPVPPAPAPDGQ
ncbi:MAG: DMT family transporter [Acidimicrobiales bacterium]